MVFVQQSIHKENKQKKMSAGESIHKVGLSGFTITLV